MSAKRSTPRPVRATGGSPSARNLTKAVTETRDGDGVRIMLATDGSPGGAVAFDTVVELAVRPNDEVIVVSYPAYLLAARPGGGGIVATLMERQAKKAEEIVRKTLLPRLRNNEPACAVSFPRVSRPSTRSCKPPWTPRST